MNELTPEQRELSRKLFASCQELSRKIIDDINDLDVSSITNVRNPNKLSIIFPAFALVFASIARANKMTMDEVMDWQIRALELTNTLDEEELKYGGEKGGTH